MSRGLALVTLALAFTALAVAPAQADFGVPPDGFTAQLLQAGATPTLENRAGAHPDRVVTSFTLNTKVDPNLGEVPDGRLKDAFIDLPTGFVGNPQATPVCSQDELFSSGCPPETQIGTVTLGLTGFGRPTLPLYNLDPTGQHAARFGSVLVFFPFFVDVDAVDVDGQLRLRAAIRNIIQIAPIESTGLTLWGVPASASHDADRAPCLTTADADSCPSSAPRKAFLSNPTRCGRPVTVDLRIDSWEEPGHTVALQGPISDGVVECGNVPFNPTVTVAPETAHVDAPSGLRLDVDVPQTDAPDAFASANVDALSVTLPDGMSLAPPVADGLQSCSDAQLAAGAAGSCPPASQIGTLEFTTPLLAAPIAGRAYLGSSVAGDPYRLFLVAAGTGLTIKMRGSLRADETTGRLNVVFSQLPEMPFSRLSLRLKGGARAPLATPLGCGTATTVATFTPTSSSESVARSSSFGLAVDGQPVPCALAPPFAPTFQAGVLSATAGRDASFALTLGRGDGQQLLRRINVELPRGLSARLSAVPRCASAQAAVGACDASSRIGAFAVEAGAGPLPYPLSGDVFLTDPYRGGTLGIVMAIRAIAGPFDLGLVVVRASVRVDPRDGHLTIRSDPLPTLLKGIPLRVRTVGIDLDRPGFLLNPTSCGPQQIHAVIESGNGTEAKLSSPFQLDRCRSLRFAPRLTAALSGRGELGAGGHPSLRVQLRQRAGEANVRSLSLDLPARLALDRTNVLGLCSIEQFNLGRCPDSSRIGSARARSPLLKTAMRGPVNLVLKGGRTPSIAVKLEGKPLRILVDGQATTTKRGIRMVLPKLPDLPLQNLTLTLRGGSHGLLAVQRNFCRNSRRIQVHTTSQSGKRANQAATLRARCPR